MAENALIQSWGASCRLHTLVIPVTRYCASQGAELSTRTLPAVSETRAENGILASANQNGRYLPLSLSVFLISKKFENCKLKLQHTLHAT